MLKIRRSSPLFTTEPIVVSKYQHVERLGGAEIEGILDGDVIVQNKLDGANLSVTKRIIGTRNNIISIDGIPDKGFQGAIEYVLAHDGIRRLFESCPDWILRGEWAIRHTIHYPAETTHNFYVFDVQLPDDSYVHPDDYIPFLEHHGIRYIKVLARLTNPSLDQLVELSKGPDEFGASQKEGIVMKNYAYVNKFGRKTWAKIVNEDFKVQNKLTFQVTKNDPVELHFAALATEQFVYKTINKIAMGDEAGGRVLTIRDMLEVLGRVWHDLFQEELWDFIRKNHVKAFDFHSSRKMVETRTKTLFLGWMEDEALRT